jgi:Xaa-Pro aminopeptidase
MLDRGLAAMLICLPANRYYLSGFELHDPQPNESSGYLLLMENGEDLLFTDSRYTGSGKRLWKEDNIRIYSSLAASSLEINRELSGKLSQKDNVGFEAKIMNVAFFEIFSKGLQAIAADGLVEELRVIKDASEIGLMRETARLNHKLMEHVPSLLVPGTTETEIAWSIENSSAITEQAKTRSAPLWRWAQTEPCPTPFRAWTGFLKNARFWWTWARG